MVLRLPGLRDTLLSRRARRRWRRAADEAGTMDAATLARVLPAAREMSAAAQELVATAEARLHDHAAACEGAVAPSEWRWRPAPWSARMVPHAIAGAGDGTSLAPGVTLFHDCPLAEITLRQGRSVEARSSAPYALSLDVLGFEGTFLSLAMDLPDAAARALRATHLIDVSARLASERAMTVYARLNLRHGPNVEQLVSALSPGDRPAGEVGGAFDLGLQDINPAKMEAAWIDLIFDDPGMNAVRVDDLVLTRRPRADL
ncbi:DUF6478 family protein [uncultured Jannaschia sp.]|uniref:DUF6478 family protein n=1 Tax=uncultured Jannaschia sp. TaxID=293347 RepID=UPI00261DD2AC|nr:DUF6478 family protein [uncultured Jannaschia sp.]